MENLVSIILPIWNGGTRMKDAILSVLGQSYRHWELLIVDDGSTDNTEEVANSMASVDPRIKYIKNETNLGIQKTLNRGLKEAQGEYIARIDDDDIWIDKDKIKAQIEFLSSNKDYVLVGTGFIAVNEKNEEIFKRLNPISDEAVRQKILSGNCFTHSSVVFRKESALKFGGYSESEDTKHIEDYDLWLKLGTVGKLANLSIYAVRLTIWEQSLSSKNKITQFRKSFKIIHKFKDKYPKYIVSVLYSWFHLFIYIILTKKPFSYFFDKIYKVYKNI
jgi:glycosyltransferase involved in cell wall biosynthesis